MACREPETFVESSFEGATQACVYSSKVKPGIPYYSAATVFFFAFVFTFFAGLPAAAVTVAGAFFGVGAGVALGKPNVGFGPLQALVSF